MPRRTPRRRHVLTHLTALVVVPGCVALCWWQVTRALSGNELSWAYVFEWPIFGGYAVFMWWKLIHETAPEASTGADQRSPDTVADAREPGPGPGPSPGLDRLTPRGTETGEDEEDEELASYNRYLAALNASGKRKQW